MDHRDDVLSELLQLAVRVAERSHAPYSGRPCAAVLLLSDGAWIPGVRVESASLSLTIPALLNASTTAVALGRADVCAVALSRAFRPEEHLFMETSPLRVLEPVTDRAYAGPGEGLASTGEALSPLLRPGERLPSVREALSPLLRPGERLPSVREALSPLLRPGGSLGPEAGAALAREVADRAFVPESGFPVGCLLEIPGAGYIPGVNVEHEDWSRILCAERNALGTAISYGFGPVGQVFVSCPLDLRATPCGACRQLLAELAPAAVLWMDRGERPPERSTPVALLPASFTGGSSFTRQTSPDLSVRATK